MIAKQFNIRPIIVNFSFIVISYTRSLMQHAVIIWLFGKIFEKVTMLRFALSLYGKKIFIFTIYFYIICFFCIPGTCVFYNCRRNFFFLHLWSNNQLSCSILRMIFTMWVGDYERIINYDWPSHTLLNLL